MARYLVHHNPSSAFRKDRQRWRFDAHPVPTIMGQAKGIGGDNDSHWWIEEDGVPESALDATKPPYRVPSMAEVAEVRGTNGLTVASTFSGCGGSCLGFEMAGYEVLWASEFVPAAREVYALNHPGVVLDDRDIRDVQPADVLVATGLAAGELGVLEGSPPCASFSTAGKRSKGWGQVKSYSDTEQRSDDLFFEYARLLKGIQPRAFVAENVSGLVKGVAKGYFIEILRALRACGYRVEAQLLDAQWLGVPQARKRIIFMGVRNDLERDPVFPLPLPYRYSIRDALPWLTRVVHDTSGEWSTGDVTDRPSPTVTVGVNSVNSNHFKAEETRQLAPSPTITVSSPGNDVAHPTEKRKFTIAELRRLCAFPDDFQLTGSYAQQWERLGRAVPPLMMRAVAGSLRDGVFLA